MNGPKVGKMLALVKPNYMLETPPKLLSTRFFSKKGKRSSKNDKDMGTISRKDLWQHKNPQRLHVWRFFDEFRSSMDCGVC
jgi:hypothetical protein